MLYDTLSACLRTLVCSNVTLTMFATETSRVSARLSVMFARTSSTSSLAMVIGSMRYRVTTVTGREGGGEGDGEAATAGTVVVGGDGVAATAGTVVVVGDGEAATAGTVVVVGEGVAATAGTVVVGGDGQAATAGTVVVVGEGVAATAGTVVVGGDGQAATAGTVVVVGEGETATAGTVVVVGDGEAEIPIKVTATGGTSGDGEGTIDVVRSVTLILLDGVGTTVDPALEEVRSVVVTDGRERRLGKGVMVGFLVLESSRRDDVGYGPGRIVAYEVLGNVSTSEYVGTVVLEEVAVVCGDRNWVVNDPSRDDGSQPEPKPPVPAVIPPLINSTTAVIRTRDTPLSMLARAMQQLVRTRG